MPSVRPSAASRDGHETWRVDGGKDFDGDDLTVIAVSRWETGADVFKRPVPLAGLSVLQATAH